MAKERTTEIEFRVVSGSPVTFNAWLPYANITAARKTLREMRKENPHQGGGHHIVKVTTTFKTVK